MLKVEQWPIERLIMYARNPRKNDEQVDRMASAIREFGFRIPIVAKSDGSVVDGHLRLKAAQKLGLKEVPVALADELTDAQVKAFRLLANQSANWAEWDTELLKLELEDLRELDYDLALTGFEPGELAELAANPETTAFPELSTSEAPENASMTVNFESEDARLEALEIIKAFKQEKGITANGEAVLGLFRFWNGHSRR